MIVLLDLPVVQNKANFRRPGLPRLARKDRGGWREEPAEGTRKEGSRPLPGFGGYPPCPGLADVAPQPRGTDYKPESESSHMPSHQVKTGGASCTLCRRAWASRFVQWPRMGGSIQVGAGGEVPALRACPLNHSNPSVASPAIKAGPQGRHSLGAANQSPTTTV